MNTSRTMRATLAVLLVLAVAVVACGGDEEHRASQAGVYIAQGANKLIVQSGGEIELQSGATLDVQSGATTDFSGGVDLDGADLIIDADGDSILDETSDDNLRMTIGGATGLFNVLTGNLKVGNGTPGVSQDGEDGYIEGTLEVDGAATFDGGATFATADMNGTALTIGADGGVTLDETSDDVVALTLGAAAGTFSVLTGNLKVGNGTPTAAQTGEDLYVEGILEVDAISYLDGNTYLGGTQNYLSTNTLYLDSDSDISMAGSSNNLALTTIATGTVSITTGNLKVGNGVPGVAQNGEDAYVEGQFEVDGEAQLDGALDANGTADFADAVVMNSTLKVSGAMNYVMDVSVVTTDTVLTAADSGTQVILKNQDTFPVVVELPAAAAGLNFCFYVYDGDDVSVDAPTDDQIHHYTNATSDDIENSTEGDWICLVAVDGTDWIAYSVEGTWTDD